MFVLKIVIEKYKYVIELDVTKKMMVNNMNGS